MHAQFNLSHLPCAQSEVLSEGEQCHKLTRHTRLANQLLNRCGCITQWRKRRAGRFIALHQIGRRAAVQPSLPIGN